MTARRAAMQSWLIDHPAGHGVDLAGASHRGFRRFRRWLLLRTVAGIVVGAVFVGAMIGLRSALAGGLTLGARATASLVVRPSSGNVPLRVTLDGSGSAAGRGATITSYDFAFGDGTSTGPQSKPVITHTYKSPGRFTVTLIVTNSAGRTDQAAQEVTVRRPQPEDPTAKLRVRPRTGEAPLRVTASGSGSKAGKDAKIVGYAFDFGDGSPPRRGAKATVRHTYKKSGTFTVTLTVTNSFDRTDQVTQSVTVTKPPLSQPTAKLRVDPGSGPAPLQLTASGSGSEAGAGAEIASYDFDFGDGISTGPQPDPTFKHTYKNPDTYEVTLIVTDSAGQTDRTTQRVEVTEPPRSEPTAALEVTTERTGPDEFVITADGSGSAAGPGATMESYDFGISAGCSAEERLQSAVRYTCKSGTYTVTLTVTNSVGETDAAEPKTVEPGVVR